MQTSGTSPPLGASFLRFGEGGAVPATGADPPYRRRKRSGSRVCPSSWSAGASVTHPSERKATATDAPRQRLTLRLTPGRFCCYVPFNVLLRECNTMKPAKFIAYFRVSTAKQGRSGLGLEAQRAAVVAYAERTGAEVLADYTEVESGANAQRPQLQRALAHCRLAGARLLVAKLDRLTRDVGFLAALQKAGVVSFVAADMPEAGELETQLLTVVAGNELRRISERTRAALQAAKARGVVLGKPENLANQAEGSRRGNAAKAAKADDYARMVSQWIEDARAAGITSTRGTAAWLNARGIRAPRGGDWSAAQVVRVVARTTQRNAS